MTEETPRWEYMVADLGTESVAWKRRLANLGVMGWELVSTHDALEPHGEISKKAGVTAILKRPHGPDYPELATVTKLLRGAM